MDLTKKTTIMFPEDLYQQLVRLAQGREVSLDELVRSACESQYGLTSTEDRQRAVSELAELSLPVGSAEEMAAESMTGEADHGNHPAHFDGSDGRGAHTDG